ncbi:MAG: tRNA (N6-isopentenyl adenosine(37)-C2)-methylthiotransferase MiaB [Candidatus Krumholzibacteriia bacterium]
MNDGSRPLVAPDLQVRAAAPRSADRQAAVPVADARRWRVHVETYGCQMNVYDSNAIVGLLTAAGFQPAASEEETDVVLLNTCSVREHAEHRVISRLGELRRRAELHGRRTLLGVCGCMAERLGESLRRDGRADLVAGVDQYDRLPALLAELLAEREPPLRTVVGHRDEVHYVAPPEAYPTNNSHLVTIHKGCDYRCTYCIVPATRGPQREKAPEVILDEVRAVVEAGGREVTLLGQNVTAYRWRDELDFAGLLERVAGVPHLERIRFLTGHPRDLTTRLVATMAALPQVCPWLHVPIQSGSDRVLRRMKRLYRRDEYLAMVEQARRAIPDVTFSSDFIVGFPGETEEDFVATLAVVREVGFDQIFAFKYSARPGTPAERLDDDVPLQEKKRRLAALLAAQDEAWERLAAAQVGRVWTGVLEEPARKPDGATGDARPWRLRTANNRKVVVPGRAGYRAGMVLRVTVTGHRHTTFQALPVADPDARRHTRPAVRG